MKIGKSEWREASSVICSCGALCDAACIAEAEREKMFQNLLRYGFRPL